MIKKYYLSDLRNEYDINIDVTSFNRSRGTRCYKGNGNFEKGYRII